MHRRVLVTGNCQTGGVTATLIQLLPGAEILPLPLPAGDPTGNAAWLELLEEQLSWCDIWVADQAASNAAASSTGASRQEQIIGLPRILFNAFHPDLIYLWDLERGVVVSPQYNSAIVARAWMHGLSPEETRRLFTSQSCVALGYDGFWDPAVAKMRAEFNLVGLDFAQFFLPLKRQGVFMHSINHPHPSALIRLGKLIAHRITGDAEGFGRFVSIEDGLSGDIWPIYPGVGESLGLPSSLVWKREGGEWHDLANFIALSFSRYDALDLDPARLRFGNRSREQLDRLDAVVKSARS